MFNRQFIILTQNNVVGDFINQHYEGGRTCFKHCLNVLLMLSGISNNAKAKTEYPHCISNKLQGNVLYYPHNLTRPVTYILCKCMMIPAVLACAHVFFTTTTAILIVQFAIAALVHPTYLVILMKHTLYSSLWTQVNFIALFTSLHTIQLLL